MPGPENHSKKPKAVTIDLAANPDAAEAAAAAASTVAPEAVDKVEAVVEEAAPVKVATPFEGREQGSVAFKSASASSASSSSSTPAGKSGSLIGKIGAGLLGGLIALGGGAALQATGYLPSFGGSADVAALKAQVDKLAATPVVDPAVLTALGDAQKELAQKVDALTAAGGSAADPAALTALTDKVTALETALANGATGAPADPAQSQALTDLTAKVAALEAKPAGGDGSGAVALAIAASGLKAAIDRGGPFMSELETYATVAPASPDVEALRTLAASGVPSRQDLINGFSEAANAMIAASRVPDPNASIWSRLGDSAKNLVKARPVGDIPGDSPEALVARMEVALGRGELDAVLAEAAKLPDAAKTAGADFLNKVKARRDTDSLVTKALSLALTAAGGKS